MRPTTAERRLARRPAASWGACALTLVLGFVACGAHAQMVPAREHAIRQATSGGMTAVRLNWDGSYSSGQGLGLRGQGTWPSWEGRVGAVMDRPVDPLKDNFVLAQPAPQQGLQVRSMHVLSDYYLRGGFRATAGVVHGEATQAWWASGDNGGGLNVTLQRLDSLGAFDPTGLRAHRRLQTQPYIGAGYSTRVQTHATTPPWRFTADVGVISSGNLVNLDNGLHSVFEDGRDTRLRPVVKFSVLHSF